MKLQKQTSDYKRGYSKFTIVIPSDIIKKSGFKKGQELKAEVKKGEIKLKKK
jgi:hypothetical protein